MKYVLLDADTSEELEVAVNSMVEEGFKPCGGIFVDRETWEDQRHGGTDTSSVFFQAMWRESE